MLKTFFKKYKILLTFLAVVLFLMPLTIYRPAETEKIAIVTSLGIDMPKDKVEVTVNVIVPSSQTTSSGGSIGEVRTVSGESDSVTSALAKISLELGKIVGLAHCDSIIVSKKILENDIISYLDYFIRSNNLTSNAVLVVAEKGVKDLLKSSAEERSNLAISLSSLIGFNKEYLFTNSINIEKFYKHYFSPSGVSILPVLTVLPADKTINSDAISVDSSDASAHTDNGDNQQEQSGSGGQSDSSGSGESGSSSGQSESGGSGGSESSQSESGGSGGGEQSEQGGGSGKSSGQAEKKTIKSEGKAVVIKKGKMIRELEDKEVAALNLISRLTKKGNISAKNINHSDFVDADVNYEIYDKYVYNNCYFIEDTPIFNIDIKLVIQLTEVVMKQYSVESLDGTVTHLDKQTKHGLEKTVHELLSQTINSSKQDKTDIFDVYNQFYKYENEKWKKYINNLEDKEDYLKGVIFTISINLQGKL